MGRDNTNNIILSPLRSSFFQEVSGSMDVMQNFFFPTKKAKTVCVFAYVVFFILNPIQEARASFGASTGASSSSC